MTHDPLCDKWHGSRGLPVDDCSICDLIARVRAHEQDLMTEDCDCSDCVPPPLPPSVGVPEKRWFK
jgi:hypothetical protein